jgi:uncharacterized protein
MLSSRLTEPRAAGLRFTGPEALCAMPCGMYPRQPPSPCIGVCRIEPENGWCRGCLRTLTEIADWPLLSVREKDELLVRLAVRQGGEKPQ